MFFPSAAFDDVAARTPERTVLITELDRTRRPSSVDGFHLRRENPRSVQETQNIMTNGIKYSIIQAAIAQMNELNAAYCPGNCGLLTKVFSDTPRRCNKCCLTIGPGVSCCECRTCDYDMCIDCYVPLLEGRDVISTLSLARSGLTCEEIERLASLLETNSTITRLDLRNNRLEDSGAMFLSRMLMKNCTLRELELGNENIDDGTSDQNKITCDGAEALADALKVNQTLRVLNLVNNQIGETGAVAFAAALRKNHKLVDLFLESNKIGPAGVAALDSPVSCYRAHGYATSQDFDASKSYIINITQPKEVKTAEERIFMLNPLSQLPRSGKIKMTLEGTLDTMYEIWEKKCIADQVDFNVGNDPVALTDFLFDYFFQKYGVKKMAEIKLRDFIISLFNYKEQHRRIPSFLQILGLEDEVSFSRLPGDFMCSMIARNFKEDLKSIKEHLDEDPEYVEVKQIESAPGS